MSHHFGLGSLTLEVVSPQTKNKTTKLESSAKFQQKLLAKQKQLEEQLIENRVKKLQMDEMRLLKQIEKANNQSKFADAVINRKMEDIMAKHERITLEEQRIED